MATFHQAQQQQQQQPQLARAETTWDDVADDYWIPLGKPGFNGRAGIQSERSCTDVWCLWLFVVFIAGWVFVAHYAFQHGNLNGILAPADSRGRLCGVHADVADKHYLFYLDIAKCAHTMSPFVGCETPQVCVSRCPSTEFLFDITECQQNFNGTLANLMCQSDVIGQQLSSCSDIERAVNGAQCAKWYLDSQPSSRRCIPRNISRIHDLASMHGTSNAKLLGAENILDRLIRMIGNKKEYHEIADKIVQDFKESWVHIAVALSMAVVSSILLISVMRWIVRPLVWMSIFGVILALLYGVFYCYTEFRRLENLSEMNPTDSSDLLTWLMSLLNHPKVWLCLSIAAGALAIIVLAIFLMVRSRIAIAIAMVIEGSKAVSSLQSTILVPIGVWTIQLGTVAISVVILICLSSIAEPETRIDHRSSDSNDLRLDEGRPGVSYLHAYNIFAFFWVISFVSALGDMVLAATFATWYWTFSKRCVPFNTLSTGLGRTLRYHLGTIAYGSLVIAICSGVRTILEYIDRKTRKWDNACIRCIMCCLHCFFWCLDQFLRYLSKNAYIVCAIHGKPFCASARHAFFLLVRNCLRAVALTQISGFVFLLAKLAVTMATGATAYWYFTSQLHGLSLHYVAVPLASVTVGTYLIAGEFFNIYAVAVDTLFLCFLEDSEINDGTPDRPYFMSKSLVRILRKE